MHPDSKRAGADPQAAALEPYAVPIREAQRLLGDKAHSEIYVLVGRGQLTAVKDGVKTLIVLDSIKKYSASLPPAKIKPPTPRHTNSDRRRRRKER
jgi:hypothetical protein